MKTVNVDSSDAHLRDCCAKAFSFRLESAKVAKENRWQEILRNDLHILQLLANAAFLAYQAILFTDPKISCEDAKNRAAEFRLSMTRQIEELRQ